MLKSEFVGGHCSILQWPVKNCCDPFIFIITGVNVQEFLLIWGGHAYYVSGPYV